MKELFLALAAQLQAKCPELVWIDLYNRQFENLPESYASLLPAALIEMSVDWSATAKGFQSGLATVVVYVGQDYYEDSQQQSGQQAEAAARLFDLPQKVYLALQGFTKQPAFSGLERVRSEPDTDYSNLVVQRIAFRTTIADAEAAQPTGKVKVVAAMKLGKNIIPDSPYPEPPVFPVDIIN